MALIFRHLGSGGAWLQRPLPEVLAIHGLTEFGNGLQAAEIKSCEEVAELPLEELRFLFPDAAAGQLFKLRRACRQRGAHAGLVNEDSQQVPVFLTYKQRVLAAGAASGQLKSDLCLLYEVLIVISTLFASLSTNFLFSLHSECFDGDECIHLRAMDAIFWSLCLLSYFLVVLCGMFGITSVLCMRADELERFLIDHWLIAMLPLTLCVLGNHLLVGGLWARLKIQLPEVSLGAVPERAVETLPLIFLACGWSCAIAFYKHAMETPLTCIFCAITGMFGFSSSVCHGGTDFDLTKSSAIKEKNNKNESEI